IELGEVEARLRECAGVSQAVVQIRERAGGETQLVAYVVGGAVPVSAEALQRQLRGQLPEYMVPASYVVLDEMPLTANGKVDKRKLPAPSGSGVDSHGTFIAPRTLAEETLSNIWSEILGLETVGIYDNFFELGGHSLLTVQLIARVRSVFQVNVELRSIFEMPTVAGLAVVIEEAITEEIERMSDEEAEELSEDPERSLG
ncbi:MAG: phosphopantetheine-binding protein, partial [Blastocatellia bacterium]